jgi:outer membrane protein TolC
VALPVGEGDRQLVQTELQLHWTLCDFGRTSGRYGQAVSQEKIAELRLLRAQQTVAFEVLVTYLQVLHTQALRRTQEQYHRNTEAFQEDARARQRGGTVERNDVLRAGVQSAEAQEGVITAKQQELEALAALNNAMGRNAGLPIQVEEWSAAPGFALSLTECLETAAAQRQEIGIARDVVAAAQHGREAVAAEFRPTLYMLGGAGELAGIKINDGGYVGGGIHLNQTLYSGGRRKGELRAADADVEEAVANAQAVFDGISLEVNLAYRKIAAARERIEVSRTSVLQSRENLRLFRSRYRNGNATPTDVIDAETLAVRAEQRFYLATYDYLQALGRLEYTMGVQQGSLLSQPAQTQENPSRARSAAE